MTTKLTALKSLFVLTIILGLTSCAENEINKTPPASGPVLAQFEQQTIVIPENEGPKEIWIVLDNVATQDGVVTLSLTAENTSGFTTTPAAVNGMIQLPIATGQSKIKFSIVPTDNSLLNGDQNMGLSIATVSEGFITGTKKVLSVTFTDNETHADVNFQKFLDSTPENSTLASIITVAFSHAAAGTGSLEISLASTNSVYGVDYVTEPAAINGKITFPIVAGIEKVEFRIIPMNNQSINGDRTITHTITSSTGSVSTGENNTHVLTITDDELTGKAKGYTTGAGSWGYKRVYVYNEAGQVSKILWESHTPYLTQGSYTYEYDASGQVVKMTDEINTITLYTWAGGRIDKEESFRDGILKNYTQYAYDPAGNVGASSVHYRQPNGEMKQSFHFIYLYRTDGNIYKQLLYVPVEGSSEYQLISTKTFDNYSNHVNPFTMVDILPNKKTQPNLPLSYRVEEHGTNILYQFSYEFDAEGKPTKRTASSQQGSEVTSYQYY